MAGPEPVFRTIQPKVTDSPQAMVEGATGAERTRLEAEKVSERLAVLLESFASG